MLLWMSTETHCKPAEGGWLVFYWGNQRGAAGISWRGWGMGGSWRSCDLGHHTVWWLMSIVLAPKSIEKSLSAIATLRIVNAVCGSTRNVSCAGTIKSASHRISWISHGPQHWVLLSALSFSAAGSKCVWPHGGWHLPFKPIGLEVLIIVGG